MGTNKIREKKGKKQTNKQTNKQRDERMQRKRRGKSVPVVAFFLSTILFSFFLSYVYYFPSDSLSFFVFLFFFNGYLFFVHSQEKNHFLVFFFDVVAVVIVIVIVIVVLFCFRDNPYGELSHLFFFFSVSFFSCFYNLNY
ncbi:hypothetical protein, unlikely [Trypanosoma brucei gambiense DAL972]|uniref:Uncharacterized protein n=1 Tax=Trypanosoma brucei gambiense (strain MHOM/CI/86/DAL972) TaxID=679716 RepID=C9ZXJ5_TRYB9|nr:hypothetical protein, unlikely [Trypanosoma brucei gambiense DAL972]CBH14139.1 hypothetical protein, unlikely [Trypanosoma brucei gambiense DAL972]|eukprot:XP_011776410.1 hypothetical protein, unlikely [Trypanosoma brucei gambiense DAL972]